MITKIFEIWDNPSEFSENGLSSENNFYVNKILKKVLKEEAKAAKIPVRQQAEKILLCCENMEKTRKQIIDHIINIKLDTEIENQILGNSDIYDLFAGYRGIKEEVEYALEEIEKEEKEEKDNGKSRPKKGRNVHRP